MSEPSKLVRRNVRVLVGAQALGGASAPIIISLGGLVGQMLAERAELATLPVSLYNTGVALSTLPAAMLMRRLGRRAAYVVGALLGGLSGLLAAWAIWRGDFVLFCIATALAGYYGANIQSYRFAATDGAPADWRPVAISRVLLGGLLAAIIGPQVVVWTREAWVQAPFAGSFLGQAVLALLAVPLLLWLRPMVPSQQAEQAQGPVRPLREIVLQRRFITAASAGVVSYGLMAFIMTAAPMAMVACGFTVGEAALGIQWHVLAMFGPSLFTGHLMRHMGKEGMTALGLVLIAASAVLALDGLALHHFWGSLILLGVGWNFSFIGATALVTDCCRPEERTRVQSINDFLVFGTVALASFGSGMLLHSAGWERINQGVFPLVAVVLVLLAWMRWSPPRASAI